MDPETTGDSLQEDRLRTLEAGKKYTLKSKYRIQLSSLGVKEEDADLLVTVIEPNELPQRDLLDPITRAKLVESNTILQIGTGDSAQYVSPDSLGFMTTLTEADFDPVVEQE